MILSNVLLISLGFIGLIAGVVLLMKVNFKNNPFNSINPFEIDDLALYNTMNVVLYDLTETYEKLDFNYDDDWYFSKLEHYSFNNHISKMYFEIDKDKNTISYSDNVYMSSAISFTIDSSSIRVLISKFERCFNSRTDYYAKKRINQLSKNLVDFNPNIKQYKKTK
jgi:hypothetical protein